MKTEKLSRAIEISTIITEAQRKLHHARALLECDGICCEITGSNSNMKRMGKYTPMDIDEVVTIINNDIKTLEQKIIHYKKKLEYL